MITEAVVDVATLTAVKANRSRARTVGVSTATVSCAALTAVHRAAIWRAVTWINAICTLKNIIIITPTTSDATTTTPVKSPTTPDTLAGTGRRPERWVVTARWTRGATGFGIAQVSTSSSSCGRETIPTTNPNRG